MALKKEKKENIRIKDYIELSEVKWTIEKAKQDFIESERELSKIFKKNKRGL